MHPVMHDCHSKGPPKMKVIWVCPWRDAVHEWASGSGGPPCAKKTGRRGGTSASAPTSLIRKSKLAPSSFMKKFEGKGLPFQTQNFFSKMPSMTSSSPDCIVTFRFDLYTPRFFDKKYDTMGGSQLIFGRDWGFAPLEGTSFHPAVAVVVVAVAEVAKAVAGSGLHCRTIGSGRGWQWQNGSGSGSDGRGSGHFRQEGRRNKSWV